jgi:hypothetical protein
VGPRAGLEAVAKRKIPCLCRESNSGRSARFALVLDLIRGFPEQRAPEQHSVCMCLKTCDDRRTVAPQLHLRWERGNLFLATTSATSFVNISTQRFRTTVYN